MYECIFSKKKNLKYIVFVDAIIVAGHNYDTSISVHRAGVSWVQEASFETLVLYKRPLRLGLNSRSRLGFDCHVKAATDLPTTWVA